MPDATTAPPSGTVDAEHSTGEHLATGQDHFHRIAVVASNGLGSYEAFMVAFGVVVVWALSGPFFHFGENWQLVINTGTTIVTFLMVFLVQATQNRDARAIHLKLDELIRASKARNSFAALEGATEAELDKLQREFGELRKNGLATRKLAEAVADLSAPSGEPVPVNTPAAAHAKKAGQS